MADDPAQSTSRDMSCPHCGKPFRDEPLLGSATRYRGFKCPHCRLFVPLDRAAARGGPRDAASAD